MTRRDGVLSPVFSAQTPGLVNEFLVGIPVLGVLVALSLSAVPLTLAKARLSGWLSVLVPVKLSITVDHAITGRWPDYGPDEDIPAAVPSDLAGLVSIEVQSGSVHLRLDVEEALGMAPGRADSEGTIGDFSIIRVEPEGGSSHFILWACGHGSPPEGFRRVAGVPTGHLPRSLLPPVCKV